jgi:hypothetical protein
MSETPFPSTLLDEPDANSGASESPKRRRTTTSHRPVSAFAPAGTPSSVGSPASQAVSGDGDAAAMAGASDADFVAALRDAGVAADLHGQELTRAARAVRHTETNARRIDLLDAYYGAGGDALTSQRRRAMDRWFPYNASQRLDATELVIRAQMVLPELPAARLERIGGALVLRAGEHVCALEDEQDDLPDAPSISVRDLVRAFNVLLERHNVRVRLVGLIGDGQREVYLGLRTVAAAMALVKGDYLEPADAETLVDLTNW